MFAMSLTCYSLFYLIIAFSSFGFVQTVPPDYCHAPFNGDDCHEKPTAVFSYYKPGSRCEIETWKGCPTLNKFANEYLCTLHCIFRMRRVEEIELSVPVNECEAELNTDQCTNTTTTVYTHVNGVCIEASWGGCPTHNKFEDKATCDTNCSTVVNETNWEKELEKIDQDSLEEINEILKVIIEEELTTTEEATTEAATTEAATEEPDNEAEKSNEEYEEEEVIHI